MADEVKAQHPKGTRPTTDPPPGTRVARWRSGQDALYPAKPRRGRVPEENKGDGGTSNRR